MAEIGMPRIPASTRAARYGFDRITAMGSIGGTPGAETAPSWGLLRWSGSAIPTSLAPSPSYLRSDVGPNPASADGGHWTAEVSRMTLSSHRLDNGRVFHSS